MIVEIANTARDIIDFFGYGGIIFLMAVESSFIPFPSEFVMIPAGMNVAAGQMNGTVVVLSGTLGSVIGACVNYFLAMKVGRPFIIKHGDRFFVPNEKFERAETFFLKHGVIATFLGRLVPLMRQFISIPAGLARMNFMMFNLLTALGAGIWMVVLTVIGYYAGKNIALFEEYKTSVTIIAVVTVLLIVTAYVYRQRKKRQKSKNITS